jgi:hypothetical protein
MKINIAKPVKFHTPTENEKGLIFKVINYNEVTRRVIIQPMNLEDWGENLIPTQLVELSDLENV